MLRNNLYLKTWLCYWKKGSDIDKIKNNLSKFTKNEVNLNIKEVKNPKQTLIW